MKQWEVWTCDFADAGPHPAVVVSHPDRVARAVKTPPVEFRELTVKDS